MSGLALHCSQLPTTVHNSLPKAVQHSLSRTATLVTRNRPKLTCTPNHHPHTGADQFITSIFTEITGQPAPNCAEAVVKSFNRRSSLSNASEGFEVFATVTAARAPTQQRTRNAELHGYASAACDATTHRESAAVEQASPWYGDENYLCTSSAPQDNHNDSETASCVSEAPILSPLSAPTSPNPKGKQPATPKQTASRKHWTPEEEHRFLKALARFGQEVQSDAVTGRLSVRLGSGVAEMIAIVVGTRSVAQVRSHVQKHFIRKEREALRRCSLLQHTHSI